jgi:hypothetical protein
MAMLIFGICFCSTANDRRVANGKEKKEKKYKNSGLCVLMCVACDLVADGLLCCCVRLYGSV